MSRSRNVRTYEHFCVLARALEQVGDRWSLLVIRDLLSGPKRFTDLMDRLGGITPKTLTQRLRELEDNGIAAGDREPGRREVWYTLTEAGADLAPAIQALSRWGWRHAWRPPRHGEALHIEHMLRAMTLVFNGRRAEEIEEADELDDHAPARWHLQFADDGDYTIEEAAGNGVGGWSLTASAPHGPVDISLRTTTPVWMEFMSDPHLDHAQELGIEISGARSARRRFERLLLTFRNAVSDR
jgi:DNA-binding HxlR family transcriptional regulator